MVVEDSTGRRLCGAADGLELLARAFAFPDETLAEAVCDGRFQTDAASCGVDLGIAGETAEALEALRAYEGLDCTELLSDMRHMFSTLYLVPGNKEGVLPYEGAFRFVAEGRPGKPLVFQNRAAVDVTARMRRYGMQPDESRHEPADSMWFELAFLSTLYGRLLWAAQDPDCSCADEEECWVDIREFEDQHMRPWAVPFMELTEQRAGERGFGFYHDLAIFGACALGEILGTDSER